MDLTALRNELTADPLGRGYAGTTDQQAAASLNAVNRPTVRTVIPSHEVIEATEPAEWTALSAAEKQRYQTLTGAGQVNVQGTRTRAAFGAMFGAATQTRANLVALQAGPTVSRAQELGLGHVYPADVAQAKASV